LPVHLLEKRTESFSKDAAVCLYMVISYAVV
jgi:hypothetical protein